MKKILLLLSVIAFFSCSNEEIYNEKENVSQKLSEENFNVTQSDIEKVVVDYFYSTRTRAKGISCEIAEIDTISITMLTVQPEQQLTAHITCCTL